MEKNYTLKRTVTNKKTGEQKIQFFCGMHARGYAVWGSVWSKKTYSLEAVQQFYEFEKPILEEDEFEKVKVEIVQV